MVIVCVSLLLSNTRIYTLNFSTHITHFSAVVAMEQKNFEQICFGSSQCSVQIADGNNSYFTNISVLHIFKVVLYFDSPVINSQIRYSVTANIESFLESPYGFLYADSLWLVVERAFTR